MKKQVRVSKSKNHKTSLIKLEDSFLAQFRIVDGSLDKRSTYKVYHNKMVETTVRLSYESAIALYQSLDYQLRKYQDEICETLNKNRPGKD